MKTVNIFLHRIDDVKEFVNTIKDIEGDISLSNGKSIVDAKSIIGIFSLDLSKPVKLEIEDWKDEYSILLQKFMIV